MSWATIRVRCCDHCGEHATQDVPDDDTVRQTFTVEPSELKACDRCGMVVCHSCRDDRHCCEGAAESIRLAQRAGKLF